MSELKKKIFKQFSWQVLGRLLINILALVNLSLCVKYLGPQDYGYFTLGISFVQIFGIIADFGLYLITLDYLGRVGQSTDDHQGEQNAKKQFLLNNLFSLRFFAALIFYVITALAAFASGYPDVVKNTIYIFVVYFFSLTLVQFLSAICQKDFYAEKIVKADIASKVILFLLLLTIRRLDLGFYLLVVFYTISGLLNFAFLFFYVRRREMIKFSFDFSFWLKIIKKIWPLGLAAIFNIIYFKVDTLILAHYHSTAEVGLYGAVYRVFEACIAIPPLFLGLILPQLAASQMNNDYNRFQNIFQRSFEFLALIAIPIAFLCLAKGREIMEIIGGDKFIPAGRLLAIIGVAIGFLFVGELFKQVVVVIEKQKQALFLYFTIMVLSLGGYFLFIPPYAAEGAAWVTVFSEFLMLLLSIIFFWRYSRVKIKFLFLSKGLIAGLLMYLFLAYCHNLNFYLSLLIGGGLYCILIVMLKAISRKEVQELLRGFIK
jgi:O-antigen/teichoic acid export membrane protein